jgi:hypothetical protein
MFPVYAPPAFAKSIKHSRQSNGSFETNHFVVLVCEQDSWGMACTLSIQVASFFFICHDFLNLFGSQSAPPAWLRDQIPIDIPFPHVFHPESVSVRCFENRETWYLLAGVYTVSPFSMGSPPLDLRSDILNRSNRRWRRIGILLMLIPWIQIFERRELEVSRYIDSWRHSLIIYYICRDQESKLIVPRCRKTNSNESFPVR